jgi:hypothetical protein
LARRNEYIDEAISAGFDVEIDLRVIGDDFFLGHDHPQYKINLDWLLKRKNNLWIHLKNINSLYYMNKELHYFWHESDQFTITSKGIIWTYPGFIKNAITVIKTKQKNIPTNIFGICTDYVDYYKELI